MSKFHEREIVRVSPERTRVGAWMTGVVMVAPASGSGAYVVRLSDHRDMKVFERDLEPAQYVDRMTFDREVFDRKVTEAARKPSETPPKTPPRETFVGIIADMYGLRGDPEFEGLVREIADATDESISASGDFLDAMREGVVVLRSALRAGRAVLRAGLKQWRAQWKMRPKIVGAVRNRGRAWEN